MKLNSLKETFREGRNHRFFLLSILIAGLSYELLRWAGKSTSPIVKVVSIPGLALQNLTTMDPNEKHLEVAIAAMKAVLDTDKPKSYIVELDPQGNPLPEITEEEGAKGAETPAGEAAAETEAPAAAEPSAEEKLLTEIRDLLKEDAKVK